MIFCAALSSTPCPRDLCTKPPIFLSIFIFSFSSRRYRGKNLAASPGVNPAFFIMNPSRFCMNSCGEKRGRSRNSSAKHTVESSKENNIVTLKRLIFLIALLFNSHSPVLLRMHKCGPRLFQHIRKPLLYMRPRSLYCLSLPRSRPLTCLQCSACFLPHLY